MVFTHHGIPTNIPHQRVHETESRFFNFCAILPCRFIFSEVRLLMILILLQLTITIAFSSSSSSSCVVCPWAGSRHPPPPPLPVPSHPLHFHIPITPFSFLSSPFPLTHFPRPFPYKTLLLDH